MPRRKNELDPKEQSERFRRAVQELVDAGELSPTEAEERFERLIRSARRAERGRGDLDDLGGKNDG